jgi:hypothetical protein
MNSYIEILNRDEQSNSIVNEDTSFGAEINWLQIQSVDTRNNITNNFVWLRLLIQRWIWILDKCQVQAELMRKNTWVKRSFWLLSYGCYNWCTDKDFVKNARIN